MIKNNKNIIKKIACITLALAVLLSVAFVPTTINRTAKAENTNYSITGNIYIKSGNSDFYLITSTANIQIIVDYNIIGTGSISNNGEYTIFIPQGISVDSYTTFNIITDNNSSFRYLFSSANGSFSESVTVNSNTYLDLYFQYYPFIMSIGTEVYHNYSMDSFYFPNAKNIEYSTLNLPSSNLNYNRKIAFSGNLNFTALTNNQAAFWLNFYNNSTWLNGIGIWTNGEFAAIKENKTGKFISYHFANSFTDYFFRFHYILEPLDQDTLSVSFYVDAGETTNITGQQTYYLLDKVILGNVPVTDIRVEKNLGNCYVSEFSLIDNTNKATNDYTDGYYFGYDEGYKNGEDYGYSRGYYKGTEDSKNFTWNSLFYAIFDTPVKIITSLFDVELLGVNLKNTVLSLFCIALIVALIRFLIGHFGSGGGSSE